MSEGILFTGFEPFGEFPENPSWGVALHAAEAAGPDARAELLPVTFRTADEYAARVLAGPEPPRLLVHVGLAGKRDRVSVERFGRNAGSPTPDNAGEVRAGPIEPDGPETVETPVDVERWAARLESEARVPARVSDSAGSYVCNAIYYRSLRRAGTTRVLFVHVPPLDEDGQRAVGAALGRVARELR